jgi:hypothetical protein
MVMVEEQRNELLDDLPAPIPRAAVVPAVEAALGVSRAEGPRPCTAQPLIYIVRGVETVDDWSSRVLADRETSAIELEDDNGVVHLFAIQAAPNTKNAASETLGC